MNNIYARNMKYLKNINLSLYNKILNLEVKNVEIIKAKDSSNTLVKKVDDGYISIHSRYNTKEQSKFICEYALKDDPDIIFIMGMGLGYETKDIVAKSNGKRCFIIEPDSEIFKVAMQNINIKNVFNNNNNIYFIQDDRHEKIAQFFNSLVENDKKLKIKLVALPAYEILYSDLIEKLMKSIKELLNIYRVNINTYTSSHRAWFQSHIINLKYLKETSPISKLHSKFNNIPAIIVGAGPSLNYNLDHLKKVGDKAIIVPVGTGVNVLEKNKIRGHILGGIDVWSDEEILFSNLVENKNSALFYSSMVCHSVPSFFKRNKFLMNTVYMDYFIHQGLGWKCYNMFSGASVANVMAYNLAQLGCNPIILLGQDFCYSNGKNYAEGAQNYEDMTEKFKQDGYLKVKNVKGDDVYTIPSFVSMKQSIEFCIKLNPQVKFLNGNSIGLNIDGAYNIDFNEYVDNELSNSQTYNIDEIINNCYKEHIKEVDNELIDQFVENVIVDIRNSIQILKEVIKTIESSESRRYKLKYLNDVKKKLDGIGLYKYVIKDSVENVEYVYANQDEIEKSLNLYSYALDKLLIMENAYKYEILEVEVNEY
ncbi:motility associated factor glycosyltransferase family protein [Clostridium scatologenes]|nr:6-hydroxymethylpterin diphosphokinase MptE-like protein [Clostridium scatologenes]